MVTIIKRLVPDSIVKSRSYGRDNQKRYITIHETANERVGADADTHARLQASGNSRQASWHWQVDDKEAIQSFDHNVQCWHGGDGSKGTGNLHSIAIEICVNSDGDFKKAVQNAAQLTRQIMQMENIPIQNVVQHNKWSGKDCPRYLRNGAKGIKWGDFINTVRMAGNVAMDTPAPPKKEGDELKFTSGSARELWETFIDSKAQREIIIQAAVDAGYSESWVQKLKDGNIEPGDFAGLMAGTIVTKHKQNK